MINDNNLDNRNVKYIKTIFKNMDVHNSKQPTTATIDNNNTNNIFYLISSSKTIVARFELESAGEVRNAFLLLVLMMQVFSYNYEYKNIVIILVQACCCVLEDGHPLCGRMIFRALERSRVPILCYNFFQQWVNVVENIV